MNFLHAKQSEKPVHTSFAASFIIRRVEFCEEQNWWLSSHDFISLE